MPKHASRPHSIQNHIMPSQCQASAQPMLGGGGGGGGGGGMCDVIVINQALGL